MVKMNCSSDNLRVLSVYFHFSLSVYIYINNIKCLEKTTSILLKYEVIDKI